MLLDELAQAHHELQVRILSRNGKLVCLERVVIAKAAFEVFKLGQDKQVVGAPVDEQRLDVGVSLRGAAAVGEGSRGGLQQMSAPIS